MIYVGLISLTCFLGMCLLYYRLKKKYRKNEDTLELLIAKYTELVKTHNKVEKDFNYISEKYRYNLSLVATYQDKLHEITEHLNEYEKKYNLLMSTYRETNEDLKFAQSILAGTPEVE